VTNNTDGDLGNGVNSGTSTKSNSESPPTLGSLIIALLVALVTVVAFLPATHNQFLLWDDNTVIYENANLAHPGFFWTHPFYQLYTPVTDTIYAVIAALFQLPAPVKTPLGDMSSLSPTAFHGANVVFHAANAALAFVLIRMLLPLTTKRRRDASAAIGALVFALHPLQVEAVAWISGANNVFSGFFALLGLILYVRAAGQGYGQRQALLPTLNGDGDTAVASGSDSLSVRKAVGAGFDSPFSGGQTSTGKGVDSSPYRFGRGGEPERAGVGSFTLATICFALALLSKPTAVTLPLAAIAIDVGILRRPLRRSAPLVLWLLMSAAITVVTRAVQPPHQVIPMGPLWFRPFVMLEALAFYLMKLFAPTPTAVDYGLNPPWMLGHTPWYLYWTAPVALGALLWIRRRDWPIVPAAAAFSALCLLATIGIMPTYGAIGSVVADRYVYLAMIGPALIVAYILTRARPQIAFPVAAVAVAAMAFVSARQLGTWTDTNTVMTQTVTVNPRSWAAYMDRGIWRWTNRDVEGNAEGSIEDDRAALRLYPGYYRALITLPVRLMYKWAIDRGPPDEDNLITEAETISQQAVRQGPYDPAAHTELGDVYYFLDRPADAAQQYAVVLQLNPNDATARQKLDYCLQELRARGSGSGPKN
jgi:hypothetical protein